LFTLNLFIRITNAGRPEAQPHRQQEQRAVELVGGGHSQNDRTAGSSGIHSGTHQYRIPHSGNDSANIERIIERPGQIDINTWKYEHVRQFVLELNLLATSLKDICSR
jgi:hypothetical protein